MKKLFCLIFSLIFAISLCACKDESSKKDENSVDIEYYANLGQMPECDYSLGESFSKIKDELFKQYESSDIEEMVFSEIENENYMGIDNGRFKYYSSMQTGANVVSYIVNFDKAFGFEVGTLSVEVEEALSGFEYKTEAISKDNVFFLLGSPQGSVIKCEFEENTVMFVFENNALCATALYKTSDWIGEQFWKISL